MTQPQSQPLIPADIAEKLGLIGIDPQTIVTLVANVASATMQAQIGAAVEKAFDAKAEALAASIIKALKEDDGAAGIAATVPQPSPGLPPVAAQAPAPQPTMDIMGAIAKALAGGAQPPANQFEQMAKAAEGFGQFFGAFMRPMQEMRQSIVVEVVREMETISRTGGTLPWEKSAVTAAHAASGVHEKSTTVQDIAAQIRVST